MLAASKKYWLTDETVHQNQAGRRPTASTKGRVPSTTKNCRGSISPDSRSKGGLLENIPHFFVRVSSEGIKVISEGTAEQNWFLFQVPERVASRQGDR